jgi:hypothetical protein
VIQFTTDSTLRIPRRADAWKCSAFGRLFPALLPGLPANIEAVTTGLLHRMETTTQRPTCLDRAQWMSLSLNLNLSQLLHHLAW